MKCPACSADDDNVLETRTTSDRATVRRRRQCQACGWRFTTHERAEEAELLILKRNGSVEPFDLNKLRTGVVAATQALGLSDTTIDRLVDDVAEASLSLGPKVPAQQLGELVEEHLRALHPMAYHRFASVFRDYKSGDDFLQAIDSAASPKPMRVRKREGRVQPFEEAKVRRGIERASAGRLTRDQVNEVTKAVVHSLTVESGEIDATNIGESVKAALGAVDEVSMLRFCTVFDRVDDPSMLGRIVQEIRGDRGTRVKGDPKLART